MTLIIVLIVVAMILVFFEVLLPGGLLGVLAFVSVLGATWVAAEEFGTMGAALVFVGSVLACLVVTVVAFVTLAKTGLGKRFFLKESVTGHTKAEASNSVENVIGKQGETRTRLNPTGMVNIDGVSYEAFSRDGYLATGERVEVVGKDNFKLIVKKL